MLFYRDMVHVAVGQNMSQVLCNQPFTLKWDIYHLQSLAAQSIFFDMTGLHH